MERKRIGEIDSLRSLVLLGILIVHCIGMFGFSTNVYEMSNTSDFIVRIVSMVLVGKCAPIFSMMFGVSFFIIMSKPNYSPMKFFWRCIILIIIGIFVKKIYTYDALMWYGICGVGLLCFRNKNTKFILLSTIFLFIATRILNHVDLGTIIFGDAMKERYFSSASIKDVVSYPLYLSIVDYLRIAFNSGIFGTFVYFLLGYLFAKTGLMKNIKKIQDKNLLAILIVMYVFFYIIFIISVKMLKISVLSSFVKLIGAITYVSFFLFIINIINKYKFLKIGLESYGKMGLTNYIVFDMIGVIFIINIAIPFKLEMLEILLIGFSFFIFQIFFSTIWMKYFKNGPFEYIWRSLVNLKFSNPLINEK